MKLDDILTTYDARYAAVYDDTFLADAWTKRSVEFQLELLRHHLSGARTWVDVACGTGYVLSQFPGIERAGLDLSPDMLAKAKARNPGVTFVQGDYREPRPDWNDRWDVVSCMWWAYCFAETMNDIQRLIAQLADWTSPQGVCFLPLCNPQKFDLHNTRIPYIDSRVPGRCMITGVTWSWIQENGKRHDDMLSPQVDHMIAMFRQHFAEVEVVEGSLDELGEGWRVQDVLIARRKRPQRPAPELYRPADTQSLGRLEWLFSTHPDTLATLSYPTRELTHVRIAIDRQTGPQASDVRAQKIGYHLEQGHDYTVSFEARAAASRHISVGVSGGDPPWETLGLYHRIAISTEGTPVRLSFRALATTERARLHFDLGEDVAAVDIRDAVVATAEPHGH